MIRPFLSNSDFESQVRLGETTESIFLDFKATVDFSKKPGELAENWAIDIAAFANTLGGSLLVGVTECGNRNGQRLAHGFSPLPDTDKILRF